MYTFILNLCLYHRFVNSPKFLMTAIRNKMEKMEFTDKEITPWGEMVLRKKLIDKTKTNEVFERLPLPHQNSNRSYNPIQSVS